MQLIKHAAAGVLLAGCACAASATTVCPYGQDEYYGKNVVQEIVARISAERRKTANEIIARNQNSNFVCWVEPRSPEDQAYCDLVFSDHNPFPSGHFPVDLTVGLELGTSENIANDWGNSTKYKTRSVREIWEIESWNPLNASGKYIRKLATTYSSNYEPFAECVNHDSAVAFLNGVFTTSRAANNSLDALRATLRAKRNDTPLQYHLLYNQTQCRQDTKIACMGDLAETFDQRQEQLDSRLRDRWEIFWDLVAGRHKDPESATGHILSRLGQAGRDLLVGINAALTNKILESSTALFKMPGRTEDTQEHLNILHRLALKKVSAVVVAHSQGNIFASALARANPWPAKDHESGTHASHSFVHVAPPSMDLFGPYLLADIDAVINGLGLLAIGSTPRSNISLPLSWVDPTGHGFTETYMDSTRPAYAQVVKMVQDALDSQ